MKYLLPLTLFFLLQICSHATTGGPDFHGNTWIDSNDHPTIAPDYQWIDIGGTGSEKLGYGDAEKGLFFSLDGPKLVYYGLELPQVMVSKNGYITSTPSDTGENSANFCPIPSAPNSDSPFRMMVLHDNLDFSAPNAGGVFGRGRILYDYLPESPHPHHTCGVHVISWENMVHMGETERFKFQVLLFDNFDILYQYGENPENGSGSSTGIQRSGSLGLEIACDTANSIPDNYAVLIEPPTVTIETLEDSANGAVFALRDAMAWGQYGKKIVFDPSLAGGTIELDPTQPVPGLDAFTARSFDASNLPGGITLSGNLETPVYWAAHRTHFSNINFVNGAPETDGGGVTRGGLTVSRLGEDYNYTHVSLSSCKFQGNTGDNGGAMFVDEQNRAYLTNCEFFANSADKEGGAVYSESIAAVQFRKCSFTSNHALRGGAIYWKNPTSVNSVLEDCSIGWNSANKGAGVYFNQPLVPTTTRCLFANNESSGRGGAIFLKDATAIEFFTCTFSNNSGSTGSVIYQTNDSAATSTKFRYCTFAGNADTNFDGSSGEALNFGSCVLAADTEAEFFGTDPSFSSSGYNIVDRASSVFDDDGDLTDVDPMLGSLGSNGGPTLTHALSAGSPAIDAGEAGASTRDFDQRGYDRVVDGIVDIGAYEFQGNIVVTTAVDELIDPGAGTSLREAVRDIAPGAVISFDSALNGATINLNSQIVISSDTTIDAAALGNGITLDGGSSTGVLRVTGQASAGLYNLDLVNGFIADGASGGGAGLRVEIASDASLSDGSVRDCSSGSFGGGISVTANSSLVLSGCVVAGNETRTDSKSGGGIYAFESDLTIQASAIRNNSSTGNGGGIYTTEDSGLTVGRSTLALNTAELDGGAVYLNGGRGSFFNSTISTNTADSDGGAFYVQEAETDIRHCTVANNQAQSTSGGIVVGGRTRPVLEQSIFAANRIATGPQNIRSFEQDGEPSSDGYNLIDDNSWTNDVATDLVERVAYLAPLANYGGATKTHALLAISPAIDGGNPSAEGAPQVDQRGYARVADGRKVGAGRIDIGAHEAAEPVFVGDLLDLVDGVGQRSLRGAIEDAADGGRVLFRQSVNGGVIDLSTTAGGQGTRLLISRSIQIDATTLSDGVTVSGGDETGVFDVTGSSNVAMHALRIEDGFSGAGVDGGGVRVAGNSNLLMTHCSLSGNRGTYGGGIHAKGGSELHLQNVTLSDNTAQLEGGALALAGSGTRAVLEHCTIATNQSNGGGSGGLALATGKLTMYSSVIADNGALSFSWADPFNFTSLGYNLTDDPGALVGGLFSKPGDITSTNPNLNALTDPGGWSKVHTYGSGSPIRNAGNPEPLLLPALASNGGLRLVGRMDIGAHERSGRTLDSDSDDMPNYWEDRYGFDPNNDADASSDADLDGDSNLVEFQNGTNPVKGTIPPPQPEVFEISVVSGSTIYKFHVRTEPGVAYTYQVSPDLEVWSPLVAFDGPLDATEWIFQLGTSSGRSFVRFALAEEEE